MSKFGPSTLRTLIADIDSLELSHSKKETIKALANAELVRQSGGQLEEFRSWIRKGDAIIAKAQAEIACLKALTDENADLISLSSVLAVLESLQDPASNLPYTAGQNWALQKAAREIEKLPRKRTLDDLR